MNSKHTILERVNQFYEENPFPGFDIKKYAYPDDLRRQASWFGKWIDAQIPYATRILDAGCGTGQLANFLALKERYVLGIDYSQKSIDKAQALQQRLGIAHAAFQRMDILSPDLPAASFDYVLSLGVLHHTSDPYQGFRNLVQTAKKGGYLVIGLYNPAGRLLVNIRRRIRKLTHSRKVEKQAIQRQLVGQSDDIEKTETWLADQYDHPHESTHSIGEVLRWFKKNDIDYINSMPPIEVWRSLKSNNNAFKKPEVSDWRRSVCARFFVQLKWSISLRDNGGYFVLIGKKR